MICTRGREKNVTTYKDDDDDETFQVCVNTK